MSGLILKNPHSVSCTIICGCVLGSQRVQLQEVLVFGCVSSDRYLTLERWVVVSFTTRANMAHPLQFIFWNLPDPAPPITTESGASDRASEGQ